MSSFSPSVLGRPLLILPSFLHKTRTSEVDGILWSAQGFRYGFYPGELSDSKQGLRARASNIIKSRAERFHALFSSGTATGLAAAPHSSQEVQQKEFCLPHCVGHVGSPSRLSISNVCLSAALPPLQTSTHFNMYHEMRSQLLIRAVCPAALHLSACTLNKQQRSLWTWLTFFFLNRD